MTATSTAGDARRTGLILLVVSLLAGLGMAFAAGWLIDRCGWKGRALGAAAVHDRQALVIVNRGGATGAAVLALAQAIQADVRAQFGIELEAEPVCL